MRVLPITTIPYQSQNSRFKNQKTTSTNPIVSFSSNEEIQRQQLTDSLIKKIKNYGLYRDNDISKCQEQVEKYVLIALEQNPEHLEKYLSNFEKILNFKYLKHLSEINKYITPYPQKLDTFVEILTLAQNKLNSNTETSTPELYNNFALEEKQKSITIANIAKITPNKEQDLIELYKTLINTYGKKFTIFGYGNLIRKCINSQNEISQDTVDFIINYLNKTFQKQSWFFGGEEYVLSEVLSILKTKNGIDRELAEKFNKYRSDFTANHLKTLLTTNSVDSKPEKNNVTIEIFDQAVSIIKTEYDKVFNTNIYTNVDSVELQEKDKFIYDWISIVKLAAKTEGGKSYIDNSVIERARKLAKDNPISVVPIILKIYPDEKSYDYKLFLNIINLAINHKHTLLPQDTTKADREIKRGFWNNHHAVLNSYYDLGETIFTHAFKYGLKDFLSFLNSLENCLFLTDAWAQKFVYKFNPQDTLEYYELKTEIQKEKTKLSKMITTYQQMQLENYKKEISNLKTEISKLKQELKTSQTPEEIKLLIKEKTKKIKELNFKINKVLNSEELIQLQKIKQLQAEFMPLETEYVKDPEEALRHLKYLNENIENLNEEEIDFYCKRLGKSDLNSKKELNDFLNNKVFQNFNITPSSQLLERLNFVNSQYLTNILTETSYEFQKNFTELINIIEKNLPKTNNEILNSLPHNQLTKSIFEDYGINYDAWVEYNPNSYITKKIKTNKETSQQSTIKNFEEDLNSGLWQFIPDKYNEIAKIITSAGFKIKEIKEAEYDIDGYFTGSQMVKRIYKKDRPIKFDELETIINTITNTLKEDKTWQFSFLESASHDVRNAKNTLFNHLMELRPNEYKIAKHIKKDNETTIRVSKTNMDDITHSLFLGNQSNCCTGIGSGVNSWSAPQYIMNKFVSAIEIRDQKDYIGNTMCYLAFVNNKLSFIIDNIEINAKYQYNDVIRDTIIEYAEKMCKEIGKPDLPIFASVHRHKVNMEKFPEVDTNIELLGVSDEDGIYVDYLSTQKALLYNYDNSDFVRLRKIR